MPGCAWRHLPLLRTALDGFGPLQCSHVGPGLICSAPPPAPAPQHYRLVRGCLVCLAIHTEPPTQALHFQRVSLAGAMTFPKRSRRPATFGSDCAIYVTQSSFTRCTPERHVGVQTHLRTAASPRRLSSNNGGLLLDDWCRWSPHEGRGDLFSHGWRDPTNCAATWCCPQVVVALPVGYGFRAIIVSPLPQLRACWCFVFVVAALRTIGMPACFLGVQRTLPLHLPRTRFSAAIILLALTLPSYTLSALHPAPAPPDKFLLEELASAVIQFDLWRWFTGCPGLHWTG